MTIPSRSFELPRREDLAAMLRLAGPVVVVQLGMMLMGVVDTVIVGHRSSEDLAAVALGHLFVMAASGFGLGTLLALDPLVAQAVGAGDEEGMRRAFQRGLLLAAVFAVPSSLVLLPGEPVLALLGQPPEVIPIAAGYARRIIPAMFPFFAFVVLRQTLQAMERVRPIVHVIVLANLVNVLLDLLLVYGLWGFPELGALGSAWATSACRWLMALSLLILGRRELAPLLAGLDRAVLRAAPLWRTVRLGLPIGVQLQLEFAAFGVIALLMGTLGTVPVAAHQVALNLAALTYMVPLGVSAASAVRVGQAVGRADPDGARRSAGAGLLCGAGFMAVCGVVFLSIPSALASVYTSVPEVLALTAALIPIAGFFQVFDGLQAVSAGVLRGLGDTRAPMIVNLLGFWLVGMPVSIALCFPLGLGPVGLWWGLVAGLGIVAVVLVWRVAVKLRGAVARIAVE